MRMRDVNPTPDTGSLGITKVSPTAAREILGDGQFNHLMLIDQARIPEALQTLHQFKVETDIHWLYSETRLDAAKDVGPLVCTLNAGSPLLDLWIQNPLWQSSVCIGITPEPPLEAVRHWRSLIFALPPQGLPRLFRFHSPWVLANWAPTLNEAQRNLFLGPLQRLMWIPPQEANEAIAAHMMSQTHEGEASTLTTPDAPGWPLSERQLDALERLQD